MSAVTIEQPVRKGVRVRKAQVRQGVDRALRVSRQLFAAVGQRHVAITIALSGVLLVSAVAVVFSVHQNRVSFSELSALQEQRDAFQREWSQLLLEQSALSSHSRVERRAVQSLEMMVPGRSDVVLVPAR